MVFKNLVFGDEEYAPLSSGASSARYAVEPDADELMVLKNKVFGSEL